MTAAPTPLTWVTEEELRCPHASLLSVYDERSQTLESTPDQFVLVKSRQMIDWYQHRFKESPPETVLEIGIFKGGSVVLFAELWRPQRLVAVDIRPEPLEALEEYIRRSGSAASVRPVYNIDQADRRAMQNVLDEHFDGKPLSLVIDDGCHYLEESRETFNSTFPYLAPGGTYVIEDWAWAHWPGMWQEDGGPWREKPSATYLALELAMLSASRPDLVQSVEITRDLIVVTKGPCTDLSVDFDLSSSYLTAGRVFVEEGFPCPGQGKSRALNEMRRQIEELKAHLCEGESDLNEEGAALDSACATAARLNEVVRAIEDSLSWRMTAPLRRIRRLLRR